jgi:hypothetical protein
MNRERLSMVSAYNLKWDFSEISPNLVTLVNTILRNLLLHGVELEAGLPDFSWSKHTKLGKL